MTAVEKSDKIIITGAAGLVGQNLVAELKRQGYRNIVALDKHDYNLGILQRLHPDVTTVLADLSVQGEWQECFAGAGTVLHLQAQITGTDRNEFVRNTVGSTRLVLNTVRESGTPFLVHISSSVVNSKAEDYYTETKTQQERLVRDSGLPHCVLRPTLMFGWFDPKHLGWLARFMERSPVFPIPGDGRFLRQPLYELDFCRVIIRCMETEPAGCVYDLVGAENIDYIDIIRTIKRVKGLNTLIVKIPFGLFAALLKIYALFSRRPPFTAAQLEALAAGDFFQGVDMEKEFGITPTPFETAIRETFLHPQYSQIVLRRSNTPD